MENNKTKKTYLFTPVKTLSLEKDVLKSNENAGSSALMSIYARIPAGDGGCDSGATGSDHTPPIC